jgi:hypothetical protein
MKPAHTKLKSDILPCAICSLGAISGPTFSYCSKCINCYAHPNCLYNLLASQDDSNARDFDTIYCRSCNATNNVCRIACEGSRVLAFIQYFDGICVMAMKSIILLTILCLLSLAVGYGTLALLGYHAVNMTPNYTDFAVGAVIVPIVMIVLSILINRNSRALVAHICCLSCKKCFSCCGCRKRNHST